MTDTLSDFLLARIGEDEAAAGAATPGPWHGADDQGCGTVSADLPDPRLNEFPDWQARNICNESASGGMWPADAVHIARHDPARVLADCAAKRAVIAHVDKWGEDDDVLRLLAQPYTGHADFDPSWLLD